ncbi:MAG: hypothetical protein Q9168_002873 [Polycauliona sp. 1 TL-2023]
MHGTPESDSINTKPGKRKYQGPHQKSKPNKRAQLETPEDTNIGEGSTTVEAGYALDRPVTGSQIVRLTRLHSGGESRVDIRKEGETEQANATERQFRPQRLILRGPRPSSTATEQSQANIAAVSSTADEETSEPMLSAIPTPAAANGTVAMTGRKTGGVAGSNTLDTMAKDNPDANIPRTQIIAALRTALGEDIHAIKAALGEKNQGITATLERIETSMAAMEERIQSRMTALEEKIERSNAEMKASINRTALLSALLSGLAEILWPAIQLVVRRKS